MCSGADPITCTESDVPEGRWQYADTPTYGTNWVGIPSVRSAPVTVDTTSPVVAVRTPVVRNHLRDELVGDDHRLGRR